METAFCNAILFFVSCFAWLPYWTGEEHMKLTPIFPAHIKPVRKGVYRTPVKKPYGHIVRWSYWNGKTWGCYEETQKAAYCYKNNNLEFAYQHKRWQGILK